MPGFLETTLHQGYDYLSPIVDKAQPYVEKARNNVPLIDPAFKKAEELVPVLITRADQLAEPHVEKMRPYVEPRIEQVKEKVAPYVDGGVKKYGVLCEEGLKYYNVGLEKVEQVKGFKDAKETQIKEFTEPKVEKMQEFKQAKVNQIKEFTDPKVEKIKEFKEAKTTQMRGFTDPKVEKIKEFKEAKVNQIKEFTNPKVEKIKEFTDPKVEKIKEFKEAKTTQIRGFTDPMVQKIKEFKEGLNCETLLGKAASGLEKVEALIDRYVPLTEEQKKDKLRNAAVSRASDSSCIRINRSLVSIITRLLNIFMAVIMMMLGMAVIGSEKILGKERTKIILSKAESCIPAVWKAAPPPQAPRQAPPAEPVRKRTGGKGKGKDEY